MHWPDDSWKDNWHPWFAWLPTKVGHFWYWMEWIERRRFRFRGCGSHGWEYRK